MRILLFSTLLLSSVLAHAQTPASLDELLHQVRKERVLEQQVNRDRETRFQQNKSQQEKLLTEAQLELDMAEARSEQLKDAYDSNELKIREQSEILKDNLGALGELHGVVRQIAGEVNGIIESSIVSSQLPNRTQDSQPLAESKELPTIEQLEMLWHLQLQEIIESGKVARYSATTITGEGEEQQRQITRVGVFNAVSDGRYLRYLPDANRLVEPLRQPPARFQAMAVKLEQASSGLLPMAIDPTRGAILALLVQAPNLLERIEQGGIVGYIILGLIVVGLLIALERFISLSLLSSKVNKQLKDHIPNIKNPLGRIMKVYTDNPSVDSETLSLKMDEAVMRELPAVIVGLGTLSLLAAIAPLLGLLGTVTGIIETFQSITLFGTGDPRLMSGGISQALVTTVMGLVAAIPLLLLHSMLSAKSNKLIQILDEQSASLVARLAEVHSSHLSDNKFGDTVAIQSSPATHFSIDGN